MQCTAITTLYIHRAKVMLRRLQNNPILRCPAWRTDLDGKHRWRADIKVNRAAA